MNKTKMIYYDLTKVVKIKGEDFTKANRYIYRERKEKKYIWQSEVKEGIYDKYDVIMFKGKETPLQNIDKFVIRDGIVYYKPCITIYLVDKTTYTWYFDSIEDVKRNIDLLIDKGRWIEVDNIK